MTFTIQSTETQPFYRFIYTQKKHPQNRNKRKSFEKKLINFIRNTRTFLIPL